MIVDVHCDDGTTQIARIVNDSDITYSVQFLEKNKHHLYDFVNTVEVITKEAISGFYDTDDLENTHLYTRVTNGYELVDDSEDLDYTASDIDSDESESDVSLIDENDCEDEDENEA
jgi:hypothetical protein|tara:strand:+ start:5779 stop:6126 length:348 start_codon:yes stop_codon:yes gene_type:complete